MDPNREIQKYQHTNCRNALEEGGIQVTSLWKQVLDTLTYNARPSIQKELDTTFYRKHILVSEFNITDDISKKLLMAISSCITQSPINNCNGTDHGSKDRNMTRHFPYYSWWQLSQELPTVFQFTPVSSHKHKIMEMLNNNCHVLSVYYELGILCLALHTLYF